MDKGEIINRFFQKGHLLTPGAVALLEKQATDEMVKQEYSDFILTENSFFREILIIK